MYDRVKLMNARGPTWSEARLGSHRSTHQRQGVSAKYVAGFLDAEGSIMIAKTKGRGRVRPTYRLRVVISNTNKVVLEDIKREYGGIIVDQPAPKADWKHAYQLVWTDGTVSRLLTSMAPHLQLKRKQATIALQFRSNLATLRGNRSEFARLSDAAVAFRESLYRRMRALNAKGPALGGFAKR